MILGVIGGVGSGKSTVLALLHEACGFEVLKTDDIAKELMRPGTAVYDALLAAFGSGIIRADGSIDPVRYGALIYGDEEKRRQSDAIVHPAVWNAVECRIRQVCGECRDGADLCRAADGNRNQMPENREDCGFWNASADGAKTDAACKIVIETALPDARFCRLCDTIWLIDAQEDVRIARLRSARGYSEEKSRGIIRSQLSREALTEIADQVIDNSGSAEETKRQIAALLQDKGYSI